MIRYLYFDGPDKTGKTSLRKLFVEKYTQKYYTGDRSIISNIVYDKIFKRRSLFGPEDLYKIRQDTIFVFVYNSNLIKHLEMVKKHKEKCVDITLQYKKFKEIFDILKSECFNVIEIDTKDDIKVSLKKLIKEVKKYEL